MAITADQVKALRDATGAGMMDCKRALEETHGDVEKAKDWLRQKGMARAGQREGRIVSQGVVEAYIHHNRQVGVLVELNSESDFVARTPEFVGLAHEIAVHVAASNPRYLRREDVPAEEVARERAIYEAQVKDQRKPPSVVEQIVQGKLVAWYKQVVLLDQPWSKDDKKSIQDLLKEHAGKFGEHVSIARFARFRVGEVVSGSP